jgi:hypothetical protein
VPGPIDPDVLDARLDPERVEQPVVVVRVAVALVNGRIDFIRALDEIEAVERELKMCRTRAASEQSQFGDS